MLILAAVARDDEIVLTSPAPAAAQLRAPSTEPSTAMDIFLIRACLLRLLLVLFAACWRDIADGACWADTSTGGVGDTDTAGD
jgi:hypothetical protein